jgi:glycogen synthase kinase 3 beta
MKMILIGLKAIHSKGVMHRDIKPENILINPATLEVKICDFGSAKMMNESENIPFVVSKAYRAPELTLQCREYKSEIDIWSAGCIFIEFFLGRSLFSGRTDGEQIFHQVKILGPIPENSPIFQNSLLEKEILRRINSFGEKHDLREFFKDFAQAELFVDLILNMLNYDQNLRFSADDCLNHAFFKKFNN